ncbi:uncharacterized protein LOC141851039 [Brevipalpus obovatus]|uniref:uncharacterized protein LOC141851039 n=1 Tax=Brevipalpus obovatus TaxID=246614 RepID=UPI003D9DFF58
MYWNAYCLYAMMCFTSHIPQLDYGNGLCTFYKSEDVDKRSLVLDASKPGANIDSCMEKGPLNTILIHGPKDGVSPHDLVFSSFSLQYEHLIVLYTAMPMNLGREWGNGIMEATSLTVYKNNNLMKWRWVKNTKFKYIRIDSCSMLKRNDERIDGLLFSDRLLTLTLVKLDEIDPWEDLEFYLAPYLRELSINHFRIRHLKPFPDASLERLRRLNFANNKISSLPENFFSSLPKLEVLILEGNQFKTIHLPPTLQLKELYLDDNPIDGNEGRCEFLQSASIVHYKTINQICPDEKKIQAKI